MTDPALARRPVQDWRVLLLIFAITSSVEGLGVSQIFAFLPAYLKTMGVPGSLGEVLILTGTTWDVPSAAMTRTP